MLGYLLLQVRPVVGISKSISVCSLCVLDDGVLSRTTSDAQRKLRRDSDTTISSLGGLILSKHTLATSGEKFTAHLWLIFGGWGVAIALPAILPTTLLSRLLDAIAILGVGSGRAFLKAGRCLSRFLGKWRGITKSS